MADLYQRFSSVNNPTDESYSNQVSTALDEWCLRPAMIPAAPGLLGV
jgi:hypothetical protein